MTPHPPNDRDFRFDDRDEDYPETWLEFDASGRPRLKKYYRWMHGTESAMDRYTRKLLGFTDNRQDAALQAGHFNDFLFVSLVRAGFLGALQETGSKGLRNDELGVAVQRTLGFERSDAQIRAEWLLEPSLRGFNLQEAEGTLRQVLAYRVWFDQLRGWRYTNPNLEQLEMVQVEYLGLDDLAADDELFADSHPLLKQASRAIRKEVYRELLDHMRNRNSAPSARSARSRGATTTTPANAACRWC